MATNRNPESQEQSLAQLLSWHFEQVAKGVNTVAPGLVESYDPATKRARVRPALRLLLTSGATIDKPAIIDVPVLQPSGGGWLIHFPLPEGTPVLLVFSQRGLENFKKTFQVADPPPDALFAERDAIALPGFGAMEITPATEEGLSIQSEDGETRATFTAEGISLRTPAAVEVYGGNEDDETFVKLNEDGVEVKTEGLLKLEGGSVEIRSGSHVIRMG